MRAQFGLRVAEEKADAFVMMIVVFCMYIEVVVLSAAAICVA